MPFREVDIHFEFPKDADEKARLVRNQRKLGRQWLSTAMVDGKMRMRFGRIEAYEEEKPAPCDPPGLKPRWRPIN